MSHLDFEFQKQTNPELRSLLADQARYWSLNLQASLADVYVVPGQASLRHNLRDLPLSVRTSHRFPRDRNQLRGILFYASAYKQRLPPV
jgi:hypothetical protein